MAKATAIRIVFMGTPDFSQVILDSLISSNNIDVVAVYTQPDRPKGRGKNLTSPPVKVLATSQNIPVFQPVSFKDESVINSFISHKADFIVVAAYGIILPQIILDSCKYVPLNVHASLLPKYRGAAPIQRAIMNELGENAITGISIMKMEKTLDTGPVYETESVLINNHNSQSLHDLLAKIGSKLLIKVINDIIDSRAICIEQDSSKATYAQKLGRDDSYIDFNLSAIEVDAKIRALTPWPSAKVNFKLLNGKSINVKIIKGMNFEIDKKVNCSDLFIIDNCLCIGCNNSAYKIDELQIENKNKQNSIDFINGYLQGQIGICGKVEKWL